MPRVTRLFFYFYLLVIGVSSNVLPDAVRSSLSISSASRLAASECQCVPDAWEGVMTTTEHEVDVIEGRHIELRSSVLVHYDYHHKRLATDDLVKGRRSIADYAKGVTYTIDKHGCNGIKTSGAMRRMCFPGDVTRLTAATLGASLPVNIWKFTEPGNVTVRTIATADLCIPVSEEIVDSGSDYVSLTSTMYSDVTLGIRDPEIFWTPADCKVESDLAGHQTGVHVSRINRRSIESND